jgi:hypothetical protein
MQSTQEDKEGNHRQENASVIVVPGKYFNMKPLVANSAESYQPQYLYLSSLFITTKTGFKMNNLYCIPVIIPYVIFWIESEKRQM